LNEIKFYFDESVELVVSTQLAAGGFDAVSAHSLEKLGDTDKNHLQRATEMGRVLCTYDTDFLILASQNTNHAGIIFAHQQKASIGGWVREIRALYGRLTAEEVAGQVIYLSMR
jgi:hypothetical protein